MSCGQRRELLAGVTDGLGRRLLRRGRELVLLGTGVGFQLVDLVADRGLGLVRRALGLRLDVCLRRERRDCVAEFFASLFDLLADLLGRALLIVELDWQSSST